MTGMAPGRAVIFVLLDGFRHDYLARTRFLRTLARTSAVGRLEEPFGFCPRAAYFGGLSIAEQGFSNMFWLDPQRSVFRWASHLSGTGDDDLMRDLVRPQLLAQARRQLPAFSAAYVDPLDIPLAWLGLFDLAEREAPWSDKVGYRSLFHLLDEAKRGWLQVSWPFADMSSRVDDRGVAETAVARMRHEHDFTFIHLPALDSAGHQFGPGGDQLQLALDVADEQCEAIVARACELHDDPVFIFAGDHGMLPVTHRVDVMAALASTGLGFGHHFAYFVDSTMVRCWFFTRHAERAVRTALAGLTGGRWLSEAEMYHWGLSGCDPRNGHAVFLADPGVVFAPSFFDRRPGSVPRGMHGYAPDVVDNQALFLAHSPGADWSGDVGVVEARRLFPTFLRFLGWKAAGFTAVLPITEPEVPVRGAVRYTRCDVVNGNATVDRHVQRTVQAILERAPQTSAILLTGSFGRGEGTVFSTPGGPRAINDYDFAVMGASREALEGLGDSLAREFGIDFVDVGPLSSLFYTPYLTLNDFDIRYGAQVVYGDTALLHTLALPAPAALPAAEGANMLGNRLFGLMLAVSGWCDMTRDPQQFVRNQLTKLWIAIADCWLIAVGDYHASYSRRRERFSALYTPFSAKVESHVDEAFEAKLCGKHLVVPNEITSAPMAAIAELFAHLEWGGDGSGYKAQLRMALPHHVDPSSQWLEHARRMGLEIVADIEPYEAALALYVACFEMLAIWPRGEERRALHGRAALASAWNVHDDLSAQALPRVLAENWLSLVH